MGVVLKGGTSHEKHIKMAVLGNQVKIQQVQPKFERLTGKSHLKFSEASVCSEVGVFGSTISIRKF